MWITSDCTRGSDVSQEGMNDFGFEADEYMLSSRTPADLITIDAL
jgi:hypothetical protein